METDILQLRTLSRKVNLPISLEGGRKSDIQVRHHYEVGNTHQGLPVSQGKIVYQPSDNLQFPATEEAGLT